MQEKIFNGRYRLDRRLGDGGMAVVYAGTDVLLRRHVGIKVLREQYAADEDFVRRFYNEAQSAARLSHPNIVNTYDVGREDNTYYIVMELVDGTTLAEMIRADGRIPEPVAIDYAAQMANGLAYAHRQGLLHRDIKPANILITHDDVVKLSDFGIARALTQQTLAVTQPGMVMGSVYYISPEQAQGFELRETSDLYSVGVVLYQMLTGKLPYTGESPVAVALKHVSEAPPRIAAAGVEVSPAIAAIVDRLLQKDPADRFASASEVATALREARERPMVATAAPASRTSGEPSDPDRPVPMRPPPRRSQPAPGRGTENGDGAEVAYDTLPQSSHLARNIALLVALVLAIGGGYAIFSGGIPMFSGISLADETGQNAIDAQRDLESHGLRVKLEGVPSDTVPQDQIVREDPAPGTRLQNGSDVTLYVSTGVAPKALVSVNDFTLSDAQKTLDREGFKSKIVESYSATMPKGTVMRTTPKAGEMLKPGSTVVLDVSKGPAPITLPSFVGRSVGDAQTFLTREKLTANVQRVALDGVPTDQVASQDPAPGSAVTAGATVTLTVSAGPPLVNVPNVGGQTISDASAALATAGFTAKITYSIQAGGDGTVVQQDPAPSQTAPKGSPVNIMVAVPGTVPNVSGMTLDAAQAALTRFGYKPGNISYVQEGPPGTVARSEPAANTQLDVGESVSLYVNGAAAPR
ncbi:MAG TPA: Stk1 family PASTA domain-containing Ser/Thr kinase [Candidatus Acidoferrales bacterium]|nr:Stk1 family PASTA domain-containing Ser/Thr kinase [Candidatus Acidoferrales bacterium]